MVKRVLGVFIIIIYIFLGLIFLFGIPENLSVIFASISNGSGYSIGLAIGNMLFSILLLIISIVLFRLGLKWLKKKSNEIEIINQIGKH